MPYISTLISRPGNLNLGDSEALGVDWGAVSGAGGAVLNFFGQGIKAQGAQEALAAQLTAQNAALAAQQQQKAGGGIPTTALIIGGLALAGVLVFAMRRK
jgi:hypothetical protein